MTCSHLVIYMMRCRDDNMWKWMGKGFTLASWAGLLTLL